MDFKFELDDYVNMEKIQTKSKLLLYDLDREKWGKTK